MVPLVPIEDDDAVPELGVPLAVHDETPGSRRTVRTLATSKPRPLRVTMGEATEDRIDAGEKLGRDAVDEW